MWRRRKEVFFLLFILRSSKYQISAPLISNMQWLHYRGEGFGLGVTICFFQNWFCSVLSDALLSSSCLSLAQQRGTTQEHPYDVGSCLQIRYGPRYLHNASFIFSSDENSSFFYLFFLSSILSVNLKW